MGKRIHFSFRAGYMGCIWYDVTDESGSYQICHRHTLGDYERSIANGPDTVRYMETQIGGVWRCSASTNPLPREIVDAFNAWREASFEHSMATLRGKYGDGIDLSDCRTPVPARAVHCIIGEGFVDTFPAETAEAA